VGHGLVCLTHAVQRALPSNSGSDQKVQLERYQAQRTKATPTRSLETPLPERLTRKDMTEVTFAKSFLAALDSRPQKLSADHVEDPKSYPARPPVGIPRFKTPYHATTGSLHKLTLDIQYILPRMPKPMSKAVSLAPGQERSITVRIKSLRNPPLDIRLSSQSPNTSILDVKTAVSSETTIPVDKIKVLHKKKPVADSKVLKDLLGEDETSVEFSVMVLGGAAAAASAAPKAEDAPAGATPTAQGTSGEAVLQTDAFWTDLRGFLSQRIRDEKITEELFGKFLSSWESGR
jgi:ubiquitin-like protein 4